MTHSPPTEFRGNVWKSRALPSRAALLLLAGCTAVPSSVNPIAIPLQYQRAASAGEFPNLPACAALSGVQATDARADKTIGKRYIEDTPSIFAPISASSDVPTWVRTGASGAVHRAGVTFKPGAPVLRLSVRQIITSENNYRRYTDWEKTRDSTRKPDVALKKIRALSKKLKAKAWLMSLISFDFHSASHFARRSGYEGRIVISAELARRGGGICWQDRVEGASENYGYSGAAGNYQEPSTTPSTAP